METNDRFIEFVETCVVNDGALLTAGDVLFTDKKLNLKNTSDFLKTIKPLFDDNNEKARKSNKENRSNKQKVWGIGDIFDGNVFDEFKEISQYKQDEEQIIKILLHCNWLMYLCSDRQHKQNTNPQYYKKEEDIKDYFNIPPKWAIGPTFSGTSLDAMLFIVELVKKVNKPNKEESISKIEELCNDNEWKKGLKWNDNDGTNISCDAIVNILLFLCKPNDYLPIPAQNKKELIVKKLEGLIPNKDQEDEQLKKQFIKMSDIDKKLYKIREQLRNIKDNKSGKTIYPDLNPFWHPNIRPFWDESTPNLNSDNLSDETLIEYKKAMVLYGPPGTSKSYQARRIAENIIAKALKEKEPDISKCINSLDKKLSSHIHILQMHPNYTYEDFIVGKSIEQGKVVVKPGKLLKIIAEIDEHDQLPHFIILDEINRVDISRVFGELFTAMEPSYREKGVELSVDGSQIAEDDKEWLNIDKIDNKEKLLLKVPENMYFIGTMNMIDFSLEQVDFALRRRFLWRLSTYDEKRLSEIISEKVKKEEDKEKGDEGEKAWNELPDNYIYTCSNLNRQIEWEPSLGKDYVIGHAFFAEIVDIFGKVNDWDKARNILWQISILPTLEAYCGTMDSNVKDEFIKNCKESFMPDTKNKQTTPKKSQQKTENAGANE